MLLALIVEGGRAVARRYRLKRKEERTLRALASLSQHGLNDIGVPPGNIHEVARSAAKRSLN